MTKKEPYAYTIPIGGLSDSSWTIISPVPLTELEVKVAWQEYVKRFKAKGGVFEDGRNYIFQSGMTM